ncbi:hypothetical protein HPP92_024859 [Vanilla planifolia]|uniref:Epidermal patterning factor-like protein n=1 Tax=Vanilla planifolia TaxID=51239 RepID=A0A835PJI3_VANPL|nr:hypothetical protein HPP92_024859 [Vanilla planifolia]
MEFKTERSGRRSNKVKAFLLYVALSMFFACALFSRASRRAESEGSVSFERMVLDAEIRRRSIPEARADRRGLVGSSPPRCIHRCGTCSPCRAVHVPFPPGTPAVDEYYPEAWRCKCGGRLFMP